MGGGGGDGVEWEGLKGGGGWVSDFFLQRIQV